MKQFSLLTTEKDKCFLCGVMNCIEHHHIFGGANRKKSTVYGLVVPLCAEHHRGQTGVHMQPNKGLDLHLKKLAQEKFEAHIGARNEFIRVFGKSYL